MSNDKKSDTTSDSTTSPSKGMRLTDVQTKMDKESEQGFRGTEVDSTPNENYTVAGVTSGAPTPETDLGAAKVARNDTGLGLSGLEANEREKDAEKKRSNK